jgi:hypothetical protein
LASDLALLGIPMNPAQLYASDDRDLVVWLRALVEKVVQTRRNA